ncbi:hypothetical protein SOVF_197910 [Spinacia oleracea]|nr:hypothetical protein SOVF_197910 [Spinacia oleracea]
MEAQKGKTEEKKLEENGGRKKKIGDGIDDNDDKGKVEDRHGGVVDPTVKMLIRDAIISDDKEKNMAQHPHNVLAFSRSVNNIDSSLQ